MGFDTYRILTDQLSLSLTQPSLLTITVFTHESDFWTTPDTLALATALLETQVQAPKKEKAKKTLIKDTILQGFVRPLFSCSKPSGITTSGRKAVYEDSDNRESLTDDTPEAKPWKYSVPYAITVFEWAVVNSDVWNFASVINYPEDSTNAKESHRSKSYFQIGPCIFLSW